jgi:hypothetical protein
MDYYQLKAVGDILTTTSAIAAGADVDFRIRAWSSDDKTMSYALRFELVD